MAFEMDLRDSQAMSMTRPKNSLPGVKPLRHKQDFHDSGTAMESSRPLSCRNGRSTSRAFPVASSVSMSSNYGKAEVTRSRDQTSRLASPTPTTP